MPEIDKNENAVTILTIAKMANVSHTTAPGPVNGVRWSSLPPGIRLRRLPTGWIRAQFKCKTVGNKSFLYDWYLFHQFGYWYISQLFN